MPAEGADTVQYLSAKYGRSPAQIAQGQAAIRERGAAVGFTFGPRDRVWNTFDAHRLLTWAGEQDARAQHALKRALLEAYHGQGRNPGAHDVLIELAARVGLDAERAREILGSDAYAAEVRERERFWQQQAGIHAVPAVVIDRKHLIQGGQPPEVFEQALRKIAADTAAAA
jgi:predicted DsbA family dithiol-disulfide isomerase